MHKSLLEILADPISRESLRLNIEEEGSNNRILSGTLETASGAQYRITNGIPRFVITDDSGQKQTQDSFGFKWEQEATYGSSSSMDVYGQWVTKKYGFSDIAEMQTYLGKKKRLLDAGCGSGYTASVFVNEQWLQSYPVEWFGVDISSAIDVAQRTLKLSHNAHFIQGDVLNLPFQIESFDAIFSEGVLHHTPSTEIALKSLVPLLEPGGELLFYVYRQKGAVREFSDDYIRGLIQDLSPQEAWKRLEPLTELGKALSDLKIEFDVPQDIPYLDVKAGRYDVQRFIYQHFIKLFWNDAYSFDENQHVNFDWYHPVYAHRQTEAEVRQWCSEAGLDIMHLMVDPSGITVRAIKK